MEIKREMHCSAHERGIMMVMLLVVITIISILSLAVLPFFGTVKERSVQEDIENVVEQARRAVFLAADKAASGVVGSTFEGQLAILNDDVLAQLGTAEGDRRINELVKNKLRDVMKKGYMRKSGVLRNMESTDNDVLASAYDKVNFTIVHNLIEDSNFEFYREQGTLEATGIGWHTGGAVDAKDATDGSTLEADFFTAFAIGVTGEHPNSFKHRDFRMNRRIKGTSAEAFGGKFGTSSIAIWNPPESEVTR